MSFENASTGTPELAEALDFSRRAKLSELMDEPGGYEDLRECLRDHVPVRLVVVMQADQGEQRRPDIGFLERDDVRPRLEPRTQLVASDKGFHGAVAAKEILDLTILVNALRRAQDRRGDDLQGG